MTSEVRGRTPLEVEIYQAAENRQTALQLGSIRSSDGTKDLTFTVVAFNKKTGEWVNTETLQNDSGIMHKINTLAETIICSHRAGHPDLPMENISYIDRSGIHFKDSPAVVEHRTTPITAAELNEKYESVTYADHEMLIEFDQKFARGDFENLTEIEEEINKLPPSELKGHLSRAIKEGSSFEDKATSVRHELRLSYYQSFAQCDEMQQNLSRGIPLSEIETSFKENARKYRTAQEPWLELTNVISSYVHNSRAMIKPAPSPFDVDFDDICDEHDALFTTSRLDDANLPPWAIIRNVLPFESDDEHNLDFDLQNNDDADEELLPDQSFKDSDLELFVSINNKVVAPDKKK